MKNVKKIGIVFAIIFGIFVIIGSTFYIGYNIGFAKTRNIRIEGVADISPGSEVEADFSVFWQAWSKIKENYLHREGLSSQDMVYGAIKGLAENIGDPYTTFFSPEEAKQFTEDISGEFGGIGARLEEKSGQIIVVSSLKNTPAERAGVRAKDIILKANDIELSGKTVQSAIQIIRGKPGTKVKLVIFREGYVGTKEIEITREMITIPAVEWELKENNIVYINVTNFSANAPFAFFQAARDIHAKNPQGIILDLRSNPGGYLEVAVNLAGWFIEREEIIVKERDAREQGTIFRSRGNAVFKDIPTVVLINNGTASSAEIMAGAMRDINNTRLIGEQTFGKGTVQSLEELKDGSMLKITIANWITPKGHIIEGNGLTPDIIVKQLEGEEDNQLNKALEILKTR